MRPKRTLSDISNLRQQIDKLDSQIVELLRKRFELTREIGIIKSSSSLPVRDKGREKELLQKVTDLASENGLSGKLVRRLYSLVLQESRRKQKLNKSFFGLNK